MRHAGSVWMSTVFLAGMLSWTQRLPAAGVESLSADDVDFVLANTQFTVLHELGHVLLAELKPPFLGGDEDAADHLAAAALLMHGGGAPDPTVQRTLVLAAEGWALEWEIERQDKAEHEYWDSHPLDIQRYYNIACLLYGSAPAEHSAIRAQLRLPYQRAWGCEDEYRRVLRSLRWMHESQGYTGHTRRHHAPGVGVVYEPPAIAERVALHALLRDSGVLERSARIAREQLPLPTDVDIVLANICGQTAYYRQDLHEVILCYALIDRFVRLAALRPCLALRTADRGNGAHQSDRVQACIARNAGSLHLR
ncbi:MAG TPA: DUF4344 domain-containing metallopeptidase [Nevskiaceae bacterium]|nr:DUF4344 domain-containing metallopeptidase [Nevskiaceae bacterium]